MYNTPKPAKPRRRMAEQAKTVVEIGGLITKIPVTTLLEALAQFPEDATVFLHDAYLPGRGGYGVAATVQYTKEESDQEYQSRVAVWQVKADAWTAWQKSNKDDIYLLAVLRGQLEANLVLRQDMTGKIRAVEAYVESFGENPAGTSVGELKKTQDSLREDKETIEIEIRESEEKLQNA